MYLIQVCAGTTVVSMALAGILAALNYTSAGGFFALVMIISFVIMLLAFIFGDN